MLRLRQILTNLSTNAMKFTDHGSVRLYVSLVELHPDDDFVSPPLKTIPHLLFRITDTGIGMDRDTQNNLFQRFYQGKVTFTRRVSGW